MELDGLDLTEQDRVHLSRHSSLRDMDSAKKSKNLTGPH